MSPFGFLKLPNTARVLSSHNSMGVPVKPMKDALGNVMHSNCQPAHPCVSSCTYGQPQKFCYIKPLLVSCTFSNGVCAMEGLMYSTFEVRARAVAAAVDGNPIGKVAQAYGVDRTTLHRWLPRYREQGQAGLQRRPVSGRPRKLSGRTEYILKRMVLAPASRYGFETDLWTVGRLHTVLVRNYCEDVSEDTVWRRLRDAGLTWQTPEREYFQADAEERRRWQRETIPQIREIMRKTGGILYCEDEASVCLTPLLGKTWALRGKPRSVKVTGNRATVSALSALSPRGRLVFRLYQKRIASAEVIDFLQQM